MCLQISLLWDWESSSLPLLNDCENCLSDFVSNFMWNRLTCIQCLEVVGVFETYWFLFGIHKVLLRVRVWNDSLWQKIKRLCRISAYVMFVCPIDFRSDLLLAVHFEGIKDAGAEKALCTWRCVKCKGCPGPLTPLSWVQSVFWVQSVLWWLIKSSMLRSPHLQPPKGGLWQSSVPWPPKRKTERTTMAMTFRRVSP